MSKAADLIALIRRFVGVGFGVLAHYGRHWLVEEREVEVFDVHEFELGVGALFRDFVDPFGYGLAVAAGLRASEDDCNIKHNFLLFDFRCQIVKVTLPKGALISRLYDWRCCQLLWTASRL